MERPFYPTDVSANLARDWPDARGFWLSNDQTIAAYVNGKDHLLISILEKNGNLKESFKKFTQFMNEVFYLLNSKTFVT
jgi:creatine kinase